MKLQKGDYVLTEGMDEETYHKVARAFMDAGCPACEYPNLTYFGWADVNAAGWSQDQGFYHQCETYGGFNGRQLTIAQVLGEDEPAIGTCWEDPDDSEYTVEVVGYHNGDIICCDAKGGYSPYDHSELTIPAKSERDKAVEEMQRAVRSATGAGFSDSMANALLDAGYRKVEL